jgi:hypothetical protein
MHVYITYVPRYALEFEPAILDGTRQTLVVVHVIPARGRVDTIPTPIPPWPRKFWFKRLVLSNTMQGSIYRRLGEKGHRQTHETVK